MISLKHKGLILVSDFEGPVTWHSIDSDMVRLTVLPDHSCIVDILRAGVTTIMAQQGSECERLELKVLKHGLRYGHLDIEALDALRVDSIEITPASVGAPVAHRGT